MGHVNPGRWAHALVPLVFVAALACLGCAKQISTEELAGHYVFVGPKPEASLDVEPDGKYLLKEDGAGKPVAGTWAWEDVAGERRLTFKGFAFRGHGQAQGVSYWPALPQRGFGSGRIRIGWDADLGEYFQKQ